MFKNNNTGNKSPIYANITVFSGEIKSEYADTTRRNTKKIFSEAKKN